MGSTTQKDAEEQFKKDSNMTQLNWSKIFAAKHRKTQNKEAAVHSDLQRP